MKVSRPLAVVPPAAGVYFAESIHATDFRMSDRVDPFHKLVYVLSGAVDFRDGTRPAVAAHAAGTVIVVPAKARHAFSDRAPSTLLLLCVTSEFLHCDSELNALWTALVATRATPQLPPPHRQRIEGLWRRAMLEQSNGRAGSGVIVRSIAAQILVSLTRLPTRAAGDQAPVRVAAVAREMEESFFDEWSLDRAAARAGLSRRRFSQLFREAQGVTFCDALNRLRLKHAATLLRAGEHSVTGVMFSCGFNDVSHFYRLFREEFGRPPKAWAMSAGARPEGRKRRRLPGIAPART